MTGSFKGVKSIYHQKAFINLKTINSIRIYIYNSRRKCFASLSCISPSQSIHRHQQHPPLPHKRLEGRHLSFSPATPLQQRAGFPHDPGSTTKQTHTLYRFNLLYYYYYFLTVLHTFLVLQQMTFCIILYNSHFCDYIIIIIIIIITKQPFKK